MVSFRLVRLVDRFSLRLVRLKFYVLSALQNTVSTSLHLVSHAESLVCNTVDIDVVPIHVYTYTCTSVAANKVHTAIPVFVEFM